MEYLRFYQNEDPEYSLETKICVYGGDADLIMLMLASHEPNVMIIKEPADFESAYGGAQKWDKKFEIIYINLL
jgi:5'-3' exonuclease